MIFGTVAVLFSKGMMDTNEWSDDIMKEYPDYEGVEYWRNFKETKSYEIKYYGGAVVIDARCTREAILIFERELKGKVWYYAEPVMVQEFETEPLEDCPF